jgi:hypothetical protein
MMERSLGKKCVSHTAGCRVPDTTPALENTVYYAQGAQKKVFLLFSVLLDGM